MKTVLIYLPNLNCGGAESVTVRLANYLANNGFIVKLVTSIAGGPLEDMLDSKVDFICLGLANQWKAILKLPTVIKELKPDVIFTTMKESCFIAILSKFLAFSSAKMVIREANTVSLQLAEECSVSQKIKNYLIGIAYRFSDRVIALSEEIKKDLQQTFKLTNKIDVIPNPIDFGKMENAIKSPLNIPELSSKNTLKLVTVARFYSQKNHNFMIDALTRYIDRDPRVKLFLVGDGPLMQQVKNQVDALGISEYVVFLGFQKNPLAIVNACDIFVLPSLYEGFSNALLEAAALNKKILVSDSQTTSVAFLDKLNIGRYYQCDSIDDFCNVLESLAIVDNDSEVANRMRAEYSEISVFGSYLKVINE